MKIICALLLSLIGIGGFIVPTFASPGSASGSASGQLNKLVTKSAVRHQVAETKALRPVAAAAQSAAKHTSLAAHAQSLSQSAPAALPSNLYTDQARIICQRLQQALQSYQHGKGQVAYQQVEDSYWNVYDNILEIKYRSYATPALIFSVENNFHDLSHAMQQIAEPPTAVQSKQVKQQVFALCHEVQKESLILTRQGA